MEKIKFCKAKCCPEVIADDFGGISIEEEVIIDDHFAKTYGGIIRMHKESFKDFVDACREGKFDHLF